MSFSPTVLILSPEDRNELVETAFEVGLIPLIRHRLIGALETVRHERLAALIFDIDHSDVDLIELVLNVRDVQKGLPVIVAGLDPSEHERRFISSQNKVHLVPLKKGVLASSIRQLVGKKKGAGSKKERRSDNGK